MKDSLVQPYLFFGGRCEEALEFYRTAICARVEMLMRYQDSPTPHPPGMIPPGWESKVMHATFHIGATTLMASDGCEPGPTFSGFSLSLTLPTITDAERVFAALSDGGQVRMPLSPTFWSPCFGMLADRYGMGWMITVAAE